MMITIAAYFVWILLLGTATGVLYLRWNLFGKMSPSATMLVGLASTPVVVCLPNYIMNVIRPGGSAWFFVLFPAATAAAWLLFGKNFRYAADAYKEMWLYVKNQIKDLGMWILLDILIVQDILVFFIYRFNVRSNWSRIINQTKYAIGIYGIYVVIGILVVSSVLLGIAMLKNKQVRKHFCIVMLFTTIGCNLFLGCALNRRPMMDSDRSHYELEARYYAKDRNARIIDNYSAPRYGTSLEDDHGPLWVVYLAQPRIFTKLFKAGDPLRAINFSTFWAYICFYILLFVSAWFVCKTKAAGIVAWCLFDFYRYTGLMLQGTRDAFRFIGLLLLLLYICNIFSDIVKNKTNWRHFLAIFVFSYLAINGHEGNVYQMFGMFVLAGAALLFCRAPFKQLAACVAAAFAGTVLGVMKTIRLYMSTGELATTSYAVFEGTPVVQQMEGVFRERFAWSKIAESYTYPVLFMIAFGIVALLTMFVVAYRKKDKELALGGLLIAGMLLPLTGIMDAGQYPCALRLIEQLRYRMYFLMLFAVTGAWLLTYAWKNRSVRYLTTLIMIICFITGLGTTLDRYFVYSKKHVNTCVSTEKFFRELGKTAKQAADGDVFTFNQIILYYSMTDNAKLLYHKYTKSLIQAKTDEEIKAAIEKLNVGTVILPNDGCDYHDYSLLPFWKYINDEKNFGKITFDRPVNKRKNYVIFYNKQKAKI